MRSSYVCASLTADLSLMDGDLVMPICMAARNNEEARQ